MGYGQKSSGRWFRRLFRRDPVTTPERRVERERASHDARPFPTHGYDGAARLLEPFQQPVPFVVRPSYEGNDPSMNGPTQAVEDHSPVRWPTFGGCAPPSSLPRGSFSTESSQTRSSERAPEFPARALPRGDQRGGGFPRVPAKLLPSVNGTNPEPLTRARTAAGSYRPTRQGRFRENLDVSDLGFPHQHSPRRAQTTQQARRVVPAENRLHPVPERPFQIPNAVQQMERCAEAEALAAEDFRPSTAEPGTSLGRSCRDGHTR
jgi:hypothetical protein